MGVQGQSSKFVQLKLINFTTALPKNAVENTYYMKKPGFCRAFYNYDYLLLIARVRFCVINRHRIRRSDNAASFKAALFVHALHLVHHLQ